MPSKKTEGKKSVTLVTIPINDGPRNIAVSNYQGNPWTHLNDNSRNKSISMPGDDMLFILDNADTLRHWINKVNQEGSESDDEPEPMPIEQVKPEKKKRSKTKKVDPAPVQPTPVQAASIQSAPAIAQLPVAASYDQNVYSSAAVGGAPAAAPAALGYNQYPPAGYYPGAYPYSWYSSQQGRTPQQPPPGSTTVATYPENSEAYATQYGTPMYY